MINDVRFYHHAGDRWSLAIQKALRFWLAQQIDRHVADACWADLVMWAIYPDHGHSLHSAMHSGKACACEARQRGSCYCGKFHSPVAGLPDNETPSALVADANLTGDDA